MKRVLSRGRGVQGFDRVAWTSGETQADRYGLSEAGAIRALWDAEHGCRR